MPALVVTVGDDLEQLRIAIEELHSDLKLLSKVVATMALSQQDFDTQLSALVSSVDELIAAVEAIPPADLTAEGQAVADAAARVRAELDHLNPAVPETGSGEVPTPPDADTGGGDQAPPTEEPPPDAQPV